MHIPSVRPPTCNIRICDNESVVKKKKKRPQTIDLFFPKIYISERSFSIFFFLRRIYIYTRKKKTPFSFLFTNIRRNRNPLRFEWIKCNSSGPYIHCRYGKFIKFTNVYTVYILYRYPLRGYILYSCTKAIRSSTYYSRVPFQCGTRRIDVFHTNEFHNNNIR